MATDIERLDKPTQRGARGLLIGVLVVALLAAAGVGIWYASGSDARTARNACVSAVGEQLAAPGSAKFSIDLATKTEGVWTIHGSVDAQNSFGALIRSDFRCTVKDGQVTDSYVV